jgi:hypothetical protein
VCDFDTLCLAVLYLFVTLFALFRSVFFRSFFSGVVVFISLRSIHTATPYYSSKSGVSHPFISFTPSCRHHCFFRKKSCTAPGKKRAKPADCEKEQKISIIWTGSETFG